MTLSGDFMYVSHVDRVFNNGDGTQKTVTMLNVKDDQERIQTFYVYFPFPDHVMGDMIKLYFSVYKKDNAYRVSCVSYADTV